MSTQETFEGGADHDNDGEIDLIRQRYERLLMDNYTDYMLSEGRGSQNQLMYEAESEMYEYEDEEEEGYWLD